MPDMSPELRQAMNAGRNANGPNQLASARIYAALLVRLKEVGAAGVEVCSTTAGRWPTQC